MGVVGELEFMSRCEYMRIIKKCEIQIKSLKFYWKIENRKMGDLSFLPTLILKRLTCKIFASEEYEYMYYWSLFSLQLISLVFKGNNTILQRSHLYFSLMTTRSSN